MKHLTPEAKEKWLEKFGSVGIDENSKYCKQQCKEANTVGQPKEQDNVQRLRDMIVSMREE